MACRMRRTVVCVEQVTGAAAARGPGFCGWRSRQAKGSGAVRDCRRATWSGPVAGWRWSVVLLPCWPGPRPICCPSVCYLCQGLNAPQFAGVDLGLAGMLTVRAVATATGAGRPGQMLAVTQPVGEPGGHGRGGHTAPDRRVRGRIRRVASWTCWPAAVSPCRTDDRCAFIRLGDTVARFTVIMPMSGSCWGP